jgi:outer membrane protein assembly factor BamB
MYMTRRSITGLIIFLLLFGLFSCGVVSAAESEKEFDYIIPSQQLEEVSLEIGFQVVLPLKKKETFKDIWVFDGHLLVLTSRNYLYFIERETGIIRCGMELTSPGLPVCRPSFADGKFWFMVGNQLLVVNPEICMVVDSHFCKHVGRSAVCSVAVNDSFIYVSGLTNRLNALVKNGFWRKFNVTAYDDSLINSIIATDNDVYFATATGYVVGIKTNEPVRLWQRKLLGSIQASLRMQGEWLYVGSDNGNVYKINVFDGQFGWPEAFNAGAVLAEPVIAGDLAIYQAAAEEGMFAIEKETGKEKWHLPNGNSFLAEDADGAYVLTDDNDLVVMGSSSGEKIDSIPAVDVECSAINLYDSTIYVANSDGRLAALVQKKF